MIFDRGCEKNLREENVAHDDGALHVTHDFVHMYIRACMHTYIQSVPMSTTSDVNIVCLYIRTYVHAYGHTCIHTRLHAYIHTASNHALD